MKVSRVAVSITAKTFFCSWVLMLFFRYCGVLQHPSVGLEVFSLIAVFALPFVALVFILGIKSKLTPVAPSDYFGNHDAYGRFFYISLFFSVLYVVLVVIDKVIVGGVLTTGVTEARYAAMAEGARNSILGALHFFLSGSPAILACLLLSRRPIKRYRDACAWSVVLIGFGCFFLSGGRNSFVVSSFFVFFYFILERKMLLRSSSGFSLKIPVWLKFLTVLAGCYVVYLFVERASIRGTDMEGVMQILSDSYGVEVYAPSWLSGVWLDVYYCFAYLVFYLSHALTYVAQYLDSSYSPLLMGGYSFSIVYRIVDLVLGTQMAAESIDQLITPGTYLTLAGTAYVDFGWLGVVLTPILLAVLTVRFISGALRSDNGAGLMAAAYCLTIVALSPFFSGFSNGNGFSLLVLLPVLRLLGVSRNRQVVA